MTVAEALHRCSWPGDHDPLYVRYHDTEWGVPEHDSRALWEKLVLDGFQAGLAWITILRKREAFREAFEGFDPERVARFGETDVERLLGDAGIVRSRAKIEAAIGSAKAYLAMQEKGEDFSRFVWSFVDGEPIQNSFPSWQHVPAQTPLSVELSKALKARGFKFCGPVIVYAWMQACGVVNDHALDCFPPRRVRGYGEGVTLRLTLDAKAKPAPKRKGPTLNHEKLHGRRGELVICGVDEAGRGPWAGPVSAGAVILNPRRMPKGIDDSKALTAARRAELEVEIKAKAVSWGVAFGTIEEIFEHNILRATGMAMCRAVDQLTPKPDVALVDGNYRFALPCDVKTLVSGDALSLSIAAASILAKVARDRLMLEMDDLHPGYGFARHKGYHAKEHTDALLKLGPCPIHRRGWAPIRLLLEGDPQGALAFDDAQADPLSRAA